MKALKTMKHVYTVNTESSKNILYYLFFFKCNSWPNPNQLNEIIDLIIHIYVKDWKFLLVLKKLKLDDIKFYVMTKRSCDSVYLFVLKICNT